jgi:hypothetical protein
MAAASNVNRAAAVAAALFWDGLETAADFMLPSRQKFDTEIRLALRKRDNQHGTEKVWRFGRTVFLFDSA